MEYTAGEVLRFVEENDVKFAKLAFCDLCGTLKNISITAGELPRAFESGIMFDASLLAGFSAESADMVLHPDPSTLSVLPWRPQHGRVVRFFCDVRRPNGAPFEGDVRHILAQAEKRARDMGYEVKLGASCEFYLFETDERGLPTKTPFDYASYMDIAPMDKGENVRREICLTLEELGIRPESSHHEQGYGQNEVNFRYDGALATADSFMTFKSVVKTVACSNGLHASFMPRPLENQCGSALHVNVSLFKNGVNVFKIGGAERTADAESFMEGVLCRMAEMTAFTNATVNSYERIGRDMAPDVISWGQSDRAHAICVPATQGKFGRMVLRTPDPACNFYLASALTIHAGLDGIAQKAQLRAPAREGERLPLDLRAAADLAEKSTFVQDVLSEQLLSEYLTLKRSEAAHYNADAATQCFKRL